MSAPRALDISTVPLNAPATDDIVVEVVHSGISTGTEKLFWTGRMPPFPGMGYPLVPGYETVGDVVEAGALSGIKVGTRVFVPGADCYGEIKGLFGGASALLVSRASRAVPVDAAIGAEGALFALAATARHAIAGLNSRLPQLIVGHGVMGRLLARLTIAAGGPPPTVWELDPARRVGSFDYKVINPETDRSQGYDTIFDVSGDPQILNRLIGKLNRGGEIVLAGFYAEQLSFAFPPAFMKEARIRIAAEWNQHDMLATRALIDDGLLSLADLITHTAAATDAKDAYATAFDDPACLKMILNWKGSA